MAVAVEFSAAVTNGNLSAMLALEAPDVLLNADADIDFVGALSRARLVALWAVHKRVGVPRDLNPR